MSTIVKSMVLPGQALKYINGIITVISLHIFYKLSLEITNRMKQNREKSVFNILLNIGIQV